MDLINELSNSELVARSVIFAIFAIIASVTVYINGGGDGGAT